MNEECPAAKIRGKDSQPEPTFTPYSLAKTPYSLAKTLYSLAKMQDQAHRQGSDSAAPHEKSGH